MEKAVISIEWWLSYPLVIDFEVRENFNSWAYIFLFFIDKPKEAKKDTFLEKLATQVIKNVQVKITDIHIKYEDDVSNFRLLN